MNKILRDYLGRLAALSSLAQRESGGEVAAQAMSLVCEVLAVDFCAFFEFVPGSESHLIMRYGSGWRSCLNGPIALDEIIEVNGHINQALDFGFMVDGLVPAAHSSVLRFMRSHNVRSGAAVGIEGKDGLAGIFGIYTTTERQFVQPELDLLQLTANTVGAALATERELAEQAHTAALQAARLKSAFLANTTHEIRSPLNVILGYSELVAENLKEAGDDTQLRYLEAVRRAGRRLLGTVDQIIAYAKLECGDFKSCPELIDVSATVSRLVEEHRGAAEEKGLDLTQRIDATDTLIFFDPQCLESVIVNPLANAIKFTASGQIAVRLYRAAGGQLKLEITDSGVGMDAAYIARLFEPFCQEDAGTARRFEGAGMGLALARRYAELNGASLEIHSLKHHGTSVTVGFSNPAPSLALAAC
jgi:signal transduction histidine kinase